MCLLEEIAELHTGSRQQPIILHRDEGDFAVFPGRVKTTFKLTSKETEGHYGLYETVVEPGSVTPPHIHYELNEQFYVIEGELEMLGGETRVTAKPGSFVAVPRGTVHAFANLTDKPVRFLLAFCPDINRDMWFGKIAEFMERGDPNWRDLKEALDLEFDSYDPEPRVQWP